MEDMEDPTDATSKKYVNENFATLKSQNRKIYEIYTITQNEIKSAITYIR